MRSIVLKALRPLDAVACENAACPGYPDVDYIGGRVELKSLPKWPVRPETVVRIEHFSPEQRVWLARRWRAGGDAWLLLKVGRDWLLFTGDVAAALVGKVPQRELWDDCYVGWQGGLDANELCEVLRAHAHDRTGANGSGTDGPGPRDPRAEDRPRRTA
jgi:hypothetical protein